MIFRIHTKVLRSLLKKVVAILLTIHHPEILYVALKQLFWSNYKGATFRHLHFHHLKNWCIFFKCVFLCKNSSCDTFDFCIAKALLLDRLLRPNSWTKSRRKSEEFPPCYSQSPLHLCLVRFLFSSTSRNLLQFLRSYTTHCKGERRKTWKKPYPHQTSAQACTYKSFGVGD